MPRRWAGKSDKKRQVRAEFDVGTVLAIHACLEAIEEQRRLILDLLSQHRLRDPHWRGAKVVPLRRAEAGG